MHAQRSRLPFTEHPRVAQVGELRGHRMLARPKARWVQPPSIPLEREREKNIASIVAGFQEI